MRIKISLYNSVKNTEPTSSTQLTTFLRNTRDGEWGEDITHLRWLYESGKLKEYKEEKSRSLPAVIFGVLCTSRAATFDKDGNKIGPTLNEKITRVNKLLVIDYDDEANPNTDWASKRKEIEADPHVLVTFLSPNGHGLKVLIPFSMVNRPNVKITNDLAGDRYFRASYKFCFDQITKYLGKYGLLADKSGSDPFRLCYVSYDPQLYYNSNAQKFVVDFAKFDSQPTVAAVPPPLPVITAKITQQDRDTIEQKLHFAATAIANAPDGKRHDTRLKQSRLMGGYVASGYIDEQLVKATLVTAALSNTASPNAVENDVESGISHGKQSPLLVEQLSIEISDFVDFDDMGQPPSVLTHVGLTKKELINLVCNPEQDEAMLLIKIFLNRLVFIKEFREFYIFKTVWEKAPDAYNTYLMNVLVQIYGQFVAALVDSKKEISSQNATTDSAKKRRKAKLAVITNRIAATKKKIKKLKTRAYKTNVLSYMVERSKSLLDFDKHTYWFALANGVLDLSNREFIPHSPKHWIMTCSPYKYDPQATCPNWVKFLNLIFQGNQELIVFIQKYVGLCLTGEIHDSFLFCYGSGHNGKSTFFEVIQKILGNFCEDGSFMVDAKYQNQNVLFSNIHLKGKRLVTIPEADKKSQFTSGIKRYTGREPIIGRSLFKDQISFDREFKLMAFSNHPIKVTDDTDGFWRRFCYVPFEHKFQRDASDDYGDYKEIYLGEASGIINWMAQGYYRYKDEGLQIPALVQQHSEQYRENNLLAENNMESFVKAVSGVDYEFDKLNQAATVSIETFYLDYVSWCLRNGEKALSNVMLTQFLSDLGHCQTNNRRSKDGVQVRCYFGIEALAEKSKPNARRIGSIKGGNR